MTFIKTTVSAIIVSSLLASAVFANNDNKSTDNYTIRLIKNCQVTHEQAMNAEQIAAYNKLKNVEKKMADLEKPIKAIEKQIHDYSKQIDALTAMAIEENEETLHINKRYLKDQESVVEQLNVLIESHQQDFDALEAQGDIISDVAEDFSDSIADSFNGIDYDTIQISSPLTKNSSKFQCHQGIYKI